MKLPFLRGDPDDTRRAAEAALAQTEAKIADLERERADALLTDNYVGAIDAIDVQLAAHRRAVIVHRDRITAMIRKRRADDRQRLEREKAERIADTSKRLVHLQAAAKQVDDATAALQSAIHALDRADDAVFGDSSRSYLSTRAIDVLAERAAGPRDVLGIHETRMVIGPLRRIANGAPYDLVAAVEDRGRRLIEHLESEPIPDPEADDEEVAA